MQRPVGIEFVSDIVCPWCAIGLHSLLAALKHMQDSVVADISFQPFELDPAMPKGGEDSTVYVARKYGLSPAEAARNRQVIRARAAEVGLDMAAIDNRRLYNTFDAHRLVHWAELEKRQVDLKLALFAAHFTHGADVADFDILTNAAEMSGLDPAAAREVLTSGAYAQEVRAAESNWRARGVHSVPTLVLEQKYLISGSRTPSEYEEALRQVVTQRRPPAIPIDVERRRP
jgi:predicted DsbA family dithiol-disulfide isomerase